MASTLEGTLKLTQDLPELPLKMEKVGSSPKIDGQTMDTNRQNAQAYDYLCRVGEAKDWMEACIKEEMPSIEVLEESLRNGIYLAKLSLFFRPECVKKIFEDKTRLQFRHSDNINYFFNAMRTEGLPECFIFELTDLYDKKNMPKVIYCIHALSFLLAKKGMAPHIKNLQGFLQFTDEALGAAAEGLDGTQMPHFGDIQSTLAKEMKLESDEEKNARLAREAAELEAARIKKNFKYFEENPAGIIKIQAMIKAFLQRQEYRKRLEHLKSNENLFAKVQAIYRGKKVREKYGKRKEFYNAHLAEIIKIQTWWRGIHARKLSHVVNLKVIQEYMTLFESTEEEIDEDQIVEHLRGKVIQKIRENIGTEHTLNELDEKVALLVKNRISIEEVAKLKSKDMRAALAKSAVQDQLEHAILTFKGKDKETNERRRKYGELFYVLQTNPSYLASLMFTLTRTSGATATKFLEQVILTLFGYAQNSREEYLFLRLIEHSIQLETAAVPDPSEALRENPLYVKMVLQYIRGAKEREYLRGLFRPLLDSVLYENNLELEFDPLSIYKGLIREEEIETGKSSLPHDVTADTAAENPKVKEIQLKNFASLTRITDSFLSSIVKSASKMPFGIRFIAMRIREIMMEKFPGPKNEKEINVIVGNLLYYRYLNPVIVAPEAFDVIETSISPTQRKNLGEIAKTIHQISVFNPSNKKPTQTNAALGSYQRQLAEYLDTASEKFFQFLKEASNTVTCEEFFDMTEFVDSRRTEKHTVYITPDELVQIHNSLVDNIEQLPDHANDPLRTLLAELGDPPANGTAAKGPGSEIILHLTDRFAVVSEDSEMSIKKLIKETKRMILMIIKFTIGKNLLDILESPTTSDQEDAFAKFIAKQEDEKKQEQARQSTSSRTSKTEIELIGESDNVFASRPVYKDLSGNFLTFGQLKIQALENMAKLEEFEKFTKDDKYQSMLDSIVQDMLQKQRRRVQRRTEIQRLRKTMENLDEKALFLGDSIKSYHDYIDACMAQLNKKKDHKAKKPMLFSKQYFHLQDLKKSGKVPQFGSFKYTASKLYEKGVLISIDDCSVKQYPLISITISSNEPGVFVFGASMMGTKASEEETIRLEDLLQSQYNKVDVMTLFDIAKINVNLLIFLINKK